MKKFERIMKAVKQAIREKDHEFHMDVERDHEGNWVVRHDDGQPGNCVKSTIPWTIQDILHGRNRRTPYCNHALSGGLLTCDAKVPPEFAVLMERAFQLGAKNVRDEIKTVLDLS